MEQQSQYATAQDFCRTVEESYSFDSQVCGLDDLAQGAVVKTVSQEQLADSGRFKRSELTARLAEEPDKSMTLYMDASDKSTSHVLTEDGFAYSVAGSRLENVKGSFVFKPTPIGRREFSLEEKYLLLNLNAA